MNTLEQLRAATLQAQLPHKESRQLVSVFTLMSEEERQNLLRLLQEQPEWIKKLSSAMKKKKQALTSGNLDVWRKYIASEEEALASLDT